MEINLNWWADKLDDKFLFFEVSIKRLMYTIEMSQLIMALLTGYDIMSFWLVNLNDTMIIPVIMKLLLTNQLPAFA